MDLSRASIPQPVGPARHLAVWLFVFFVSFIGLATELLVSFRMLGGPFRQDIATVCRDWLYDHLDDLPIRQEDFGASTRFLAAAKELVEKHRQSFPIEPRVRLESLVQTDVRLDRLPSIADQARVFRAAQEVLQIVKGLATHAGSKTRSAQ